MDSFKFYLKYISDVIKGEEYLSDRDKFTLLLHGCALIHIIDGFLFLGFGNIAMLIYNLLSFLAYEWMVSLAKSKQFKTVTIICTVEVLLFVIFSTLFYGNFLCFNLYCFLMIPSAFYITTIAKSIKHPFLSASIVSGLSIITFMFSVLYKCNLDSDFFNDYAVLIVVTKVLNVLFTMIFLMSISFMFSMEMRNSTSALEHKNNQLKKLSSSDPLTKLANRRSMMEQLNLAMHKLKRDKKHFSVILGDIDDFKKVNDTYGHDCGDKVLVMVSQTISSQMRDGDFVCRWGGEEILILVNGNLEAAKSLAERILANVCANEVYSDNKVIKVTMTFGVAEANESFRIEDFIQQADSRLYYGKSHGKCQVVSNIP